MTKHNDRKEGRSMRRPNLLWLVTALLLSLALVAAGCGGDEGGGDDSSPVAGGGSPTEGKQGGDVTFLAAGDIDYLDPGQTYYTFGYMVQYAVNRPLYSFEPTNGEEPVPDLADGEPEISEDNRQITVKLKRGVRYAPPVDREVTSADVKYAIERAFTTNVPSGYATSYFAEIEGAPEKPVSIGKLEPFSGLETPDEQTLVIKLTEPVAQRMAAALVMPITIPVPEEYAKEFDKESPSTYNEQVAFTGPYMVENDPETGEVTGHEQGKEIRLVRNPNWDAETDYKPAFLDSITIEEGNEDQVAARRTLAGQRLMCCDAGQPPISILRRALERNEDQIGRVSGGGTRWIALNTTMKPFDNINVRKAVIAAFDRNALRKTRGGEEVGPIAQHYIPPGIPGHEESNGTDGFGDEFDWMAHPEGNLELAKEYMRRAGEEGVPVTEDGLYDGDEELLTTAANAEPGSQTAQIAQSEFEKLGFKLNFRQMPQDTIYTRFCGRPAAEVAICPNVGWFKDFQDAESMLVPTFSGEAIKPQGNVNWSQLDNDEIDQAMKEAAQLELGDERNQAWAEINKMIVGQATGIPYVWDDSISLASPDVKMVVSEYHTTPDLAFSSLK
jgi:peptide/nickel transport system substrate-binding protein